MAIDEKALDEIIARLEKEVAARPRDTGVRLQLALTYMKRMRRDEAVAQLEKVIEQDRRNVEAHYYLGIVHADLGDLDKAQEFFEKTVGIDRRHGPSHYFLGKIMAMRGNIDGAVKETEKSVEANPGNVLAHSQLGELYIATNRPADAAVHWQKILELDPSNLQALHNMGALITDMHQYDKALDYLTRAERLGSDNAGLFYNLGICYLATGQAEKAAKALEKSLELEPENATTLTTMGEVYATSDDLDKAIGCWQKALIHEPDAIPPMYNLGLAFFQKSLKEEKKELRDDAIIMWEKCLAQDRTYVPAYRSLSAASVMTGDLDAAIARWESLAMFMPGNVEAVLSVGDLSFRKGDFEKAEQCAQGLLEKMEQVEDAPGQKEVRSSIELLYGSALVAHGKVREGLNHWVQAMGLDPNFALSNSTFIGRAIWPGLIEVAKAEAKNEDQSKVTGLIGSLVKEETRAPANAAAPSSAKEKKGGLPWFTRGKK